MSKFDASLEVLFYFPYYIQNFLGYISGFVYILSDDIDIIIDLVYEILVRSCSRCSGGIVADCIANIIDEIKYNQRICYSIYMQAASDKNFIDQINDYINVITKNINKATDIAKKVLDVIGEVEEHLQGGIKFAQEGYGDAWIQLQKLRRAQAAGEYIAPNRIFLLETVCDGYEAEIKGLRV